MGSSCRSCGTTGTHASWCEYNANLVSLDDWIDRGACGDKPEVMFGVGSAAENKARAICATCPVVRQCLEYSIAAKVTEGVWGGANIHQRSRLRHHGNRDSAIARHIEDLREPVKAGA